MRSLLIRDIKLLAGTHAPSSRLLRGSEMGQLPAIEHAFLFIENGLIADFGPMSGLGERYGASPSLSASGGMVLPAWCDSHTHLVFAAYREEEFVMKLQGRSYEEIAAAGGGILNSARKLENCPEDDLFEQAWQRLEQVMQLGTGAIEIKSGYGLSLEAELKMLRVIRRLKERAPIPLKATFLGAHAFPKAFQQDQEGYIRLLIEEMLPEIAAEGLADYIDVFCEKGFFSTGQTSRILEAGSRYGLKAKVHANQLSASGAVETAVAAGALSVDHLEQMDEAAYQALENSETLAILLPNCSLYLGIPFAPARQLIERNIPVALASDFNPGSSPSGNMNLVVSLGCIRQKMLPEEAINAATLNGAAAMEVSEETGSISIGKRANLILTKPVPSLAFLPYAFGQNHIQQVFVNGIAI